MNARRHAVSALLVVMLAACGSPAGGSMPAGSSAAEPSSTKAAEASPTASPLAIGLTLAPGTYTSSVFATPLTFTVPNGWKAFEDEPGQFGLAQVANDGPCLCVWRDVRAAATSCAEAPEPGVGDSAQEIAAWLAERDGLTTTTPEPITVGGLDGYVIDVSIDPSWSTACPFSQGHPLVMTLVGTDISRGVHWGTDAMSSQRYVLLDLGPDGADGNVAITVEVCCGVGFDERTEAVEPVIDSFVFHPGA